jgi:predicted TIM-barrel fold metal-dependent hydrolase
VAPEALEGLRLVDHHCHSVVASVLSRPALEDLLSEGQGMRATGSNFDSFMGLSVRRWCAPVLGLDPGAPPEEYAERRADLGPAEVNRRLLGQAAVGTMLVDTGLGDPRLASMNDLAASAGSTVHEIVRLEVVAEQVAAAGSSGAGFADDFATALAQRLPGAVGLKSVLAYRHGLDVEPRAPGPAEVREAAGEWLAGLSASAGRPRLSHPVLLRHLIWEGLRTGLPLQVHCGYGDTDLDLLKADPAQLTGLIRATADLGTPIMLLHCYPFHRNAAYLAAVYPHVYFDVGFAVPWVSQAVATVLSEAMETAPFHKFLYSSDAYGLAELHYLGAKRFRQGLAQVLAGLSAEGWDDAETTRIATLVASANAERVYALQPAGINRPSLPSAARSGGSTPPRTPSAGSSSPAR